MAEYNRDRKDNSSRAKLIGTGMAVSFHLLLASVLVINGFKTVYPPPPEMGVEVELEMVFEPPRPIQVRTGSQPRVERPTPDDIRLVQRSESRIQGTQPNRGRATTTGETGDVEQYEPPRDSINMRALFPSAANGDSLAPQTSRESSNELRAGHPDGNIRSGSTEGVPNANLPGRSINGSLPTPVYNVNADGTVIVSILVDQQGNVTRATVRPNGTTATSNILWDAARNAALKAKFNVSPSSPAVQEGTITYIFRLK